MLQKQFCLGNVNILNLVIGYREFDEPLLVIMKFQQLDRANLMINVSNLGKGEWCFRGE